MTSGAIRRRAVQLLAALLTTSGALTVGATAASATPMFPQCPAVGADTGCAVLVTVAADGSTTVQTDPSQPSFNGHDGVLVGVDNTSDLAVTSIPLSGFNVFAFRGQGLCAQGNAPAGCPFGPTGYEGPGTAFAVTNASSGSVQFPVGRGLAPQATTYFSTGNRFTAGTATLGPAVTVTASPISPVEGNALDDATVATFTDPDPGRGSGDFTATVSWGDGTADSAGTVTGPNGGPYTVTASHTYAEEGSDTLTVTVTDDLDSTNTGSASEPVTVADAPLTGSGTDFSATTGQATGPVTIATFTDGNPDATSADYPPGSVTVDWGDGSGLDASATVSGPSGGTFAVTGDHTYAQHGTYTVTVTVTDVGGSTLTVTGTATVADTVGNCPADQDCTVDNNVPGTQNVAVSGTSTTNATVYVSTDPSGLSCGDTFRHAPLITTLSTSNFSSKKPIIVTITFPNNQGVGPAGRPFRVCFNSTVPFKDSSGHLVTTGLLPMCHSGPKVDPPCVKYIVHAFGKTYERIAIPSNDPRFH